MKHRIARTCATLLKIEYRCWYGGVGARSDHGCIYPAREPAATTLELAVPRATPRRLRPRVAAVRRPLHPHRQRRRLARIPTAPDEVVPGSGLRPHPLGHAVDLVVGDVVFEDEVAALLSLPTDEPRSAQAPWSTNRGAQEVRATDLGDVDALVVLLDEVVQHDHLHQHRLHRLRPRRRNPAPIPLASALHLAMLRTSFCALLTAS